MRKYRLHPSIYSYYRIPKLQKWRGVSSQTQRWHLATFYLNSKIYKNGGGSVPRHYYDSQPYFIWTPKLQKRRGVCIQTRRWFLAIFILSNWKLFWDSYVAIKPLAHLSRIMILVIKTSFKKSLEISKIHWSDYW